MGKKSLRLVAMVMAFVFGLTMALLPAKVTAQQQQPTQAPAQAGAAAGKAGAEAGAATAAGISTGTIVAGVLAAAAIAAIAAASGGGGEAIVTQPSLPLTKEQLETLAAAFNYQVTIDGQNYTLADILANITWQDFANMTLDASMQSILKAYLNFLKTNNPDLYSKLLSLLKDLQKDQQKFNLVKEWAKNPSTLADVLKNAGSSTQFVYNPVNHGTTTTHTTTVHH